MASETIDRIATLLTAIATAATALLMWQSNRKQTAGERPIVECDVTTPGDGLLKIEFAVRNRMDETLVVTAARVVRPHRSKISLPAWSMHGLMEPTEPTASMVEIAREVDSIGSLRSSLMPIGASQYRSDIANLDLYVLPPHGWAGGALRIDLRISNKSFAVRDKWVAVRRTISAESAKKIGERALKTDQKS